MLPRILLTIPALQFGIVPPIVDFTDSHVFHHGWPGHARFHMVWQVLLVSALAVYILWLIWKRGPEPEARLRHASVLGCLVLGAFFVNTALMGLYGGLLADPEHQMLVAGIDGNLFIFALMGVLQLAGTVMVWRR